MMKCLYFLLLVVASQAFVTRESGDDQDIPVPNLTRVTLMDDPSLAFKVDWTRVSTNEDEDPILGYKLKVWEQPKSNKYNYERENGYKMLDDDNTSDRYSNWDDNQDHKRRDIHVNGEETTSAEVDDIESGVTYEVRVQAVTRNGDGPLSRPMRIQVLKDNDDDRQKEEYNVE